MGIASFFASDPHRYEGVRPVNLWACACSTC